MSQSYAYKIDDTANDRVNSDLLGQEIATAALGAALEDITTLKNAPPNDDLSIKFAAALSAGDKTTLDGVVAAHQGTTTISRTQRASSAGSSDNLTGAYDTKATLTSLPRRAGLYVAQWYAEVRVANGALGDRCMAVVAVDGSNVGETNGFTANWQSFSGFTPMVLAEGAAPVIEVKWRLMNGGGDTAQIRRTRVMIISQDE